MVIYGVQANISIGKLFAAGFIPGAVMALFMMVMVAYYAHVRKYGADIAFSWPRMGRAFFELGFVAVTAVALYFLWSREGLPGWLRFGALLVGTMVADKLFKFEAYMALLTPVILIGGMATGLFTPTEAAVAAVAWALFLGFVWYRTLNWRMLIKISMETIETTAIVLFIVASASIFAWVLTTTQVTEAIAQWVLSISDNPLRVPAAREHLPAVRRLLHGDDRRDHDPGARVHADHRQARHRPGALRPGDDAEPDDRPADAAGRHGAVRPAEGGEDLVRGDGEGGAAVAVAAARDAGAHHLRSAARALAARHPLSEVGAHRARIETVEILQVDLPPKVVRTDAIQSFVTQETPIVRIRCDDGAEGIGYTYTIGTGGSSVVALLRDHLAPQLIGRDPDCIEAIWKDLFFHTHATAVGAITSLALAAIDTALWDLRCRRVGLPLWKAAGGAQPKVPVYTTEGGWLHLSADALVAQTIEAKAQGFRGAKLKVGKPHVSEDVARLRAVREAVGDAFEIMVDANQCFTVSEAIRRARAFEPFGLAWLEEPLPAEDLAGHVELAAHTAMPIAVGESLYHPGAFPRVPRARRLLDRPGRLRADRRHHAVAQGRASRRDVQRRGLPALPDGAARVADGGGAERRLGRVHSAARRPHDVAARDGRRLRDRAVERPASASTGTSPRSTARRRARESPLMAMLNCQGGHAPCSHALRSPSACTPTTTS